MRRPTVLTNPPVKRRPRVSDEVLSALGVTDPEAPEVSYAHLPAQDEELLLSLVGTVVRDSSPWALRGSRAEGIATRLLREAAVGVTEMPSNSSLDEEAFYQERLKAHAGAADPEDAAWEDLTAERELLVPGVIVELASVKGDAVFLMRVVEDPAHDEALARALAWVVESWSALTRTSQPGWAMLPMFSHLLSTSRHPLGRRAAATWEAFDTFWRQYGRLRLQSELSALGLGRVNGVTPSSLEALSGDELAAVAFSALGAYPESSTYGALYFMAKKGTDRAGFRRLLDGLCAREGWTLSGLDLALHCADVAPSSAELARVSADPEAAFATRLAATPANRLGGATRRLVSSYVVPSRGERRSYGAFLDAVAPPRSLEELGPLLVDEEVTPSLLEVVAAFDQAFREDRDPASLPADVLRFDVSTPSSLFYAWPDPDRQAWASRLLRAKKAAVREWIEAEHSVEAQ
jgi:hypothetical protein